MAPDHDSARMVNVRVVAVASPSATKAATDVIGTSVSTNVLSAKRGADNAFVVSVVVWGDRDAVARVAASVARHNAAGFRSALVRPAGGLATRIAG